MMSGSLLCKLLQKKTYDALSKKHTLLLVFIAFVILLVSALRFGESLIEWSNERYALAFSPYSDNIARKNFRNMLCQFVPIDVVYTWVNGSDPKFLKDLHKAKEDYGFLNPHINCSYSNCVKSHMVLLRPQLPNTVTLSDLEESDIIFQHIAKMFVISTHEGTFENVTVLVFPDINIADQVLSKRILTLDSQNYTLSTAFVTDSWNSPNTVLLNNVLIVSPIPDDLTQADVISKLPIAIKSYISKVYIHEEKSLAVLTVNGPDVANVVSKLSNFTILSKVASISPSYLVVDLPSDHEDVTSSRFTDNGELKYSLRSLEKYAPWVRHVFIITNGQIPSWLNLEHPMVTIVTHEDIFPNKSHLPTFSSPAIECHLHRIPNLSEKFLYLNDDVLFGKAVWPEDFYTHTKGQKVYLSWPVPNCAEGCPSSWIRDGYCDKPCNNSQCQYDGGDCSSDNPMLGLQLYNPLTDTRRGASFNFKKNYCSDDCTDNWLADKYCDKACNVRACAYDAGDCGLANFNKFPKFTFSLNQSYYILPEGESIGYFDLTDYLDSNDTLTEGMYEENPVIRTIAISLKFSIISVVLHPNHNATNITFTLKGKSNGETFEKEIYIRCSTMPVSTTIGNVTNVESSQETEEIIFENFNENDRFPKVLVPVESETSNFEFSNVNISASQLPNDIIKRINEFREKFETGVLTLKGYLKKKSEIISSYIHSTDRKVNLVLENVIHYSLSEIHAEIDSSRQKLQLNAQKIESFSPFQARNLKQFLNPGEEKRTTDSEANKASKSVLGEYFKGLGKNITDKKVVDETQKPARHKLDDTFGDSLRHVNKLYNEAFGYESRKVPSHIAHFVDRNVMSRLTSRFQNAFDVTSSHQIRSSNDMQFAFSYYYYLMSEMESIGIEDLFHYFDVDNSGAWSDREIRTVILRMYELPINISALIEFETLIINCSLSLPVTNSESEIAQDEHYYEPKMPLLTKSLLKSCQSASELLSKHFGSRKRNAYEILGEEEVVFKMIHNNLSRVLSQIDDIRKNPKKFICLNDNMKHGTEEAKRIRAHLQDFYESLFPIPSQFEHPVTYRNRFLYVSELKDWRKIRDITRIVAYLSLGILIFFSAITFWKTEIRRNEQYPRLREIEKRRSSRV